MCWAWRMDSRVGRPVPLNFSSAGGCRPGADCCSRSRRSGWIYRFGSTILFSEEAVVDRISRVTVPARTGVAEENDARTAECRGDCDLVRRFATGCLDEKDRPAAVRGARAGGPADSVVGKVRSSRVLRQGASGAGRVDYYSRAGDSDLDGWDWAAPLVAGFGWVKPWHRVMAEVSASGAEDYFLGDDRDCSLADRATRVGFAVDSAAGD